jgi:outer membrane receptor protein involved in Fe transport
MNHRGRAVSHFTLAMLAVLWGAVSYAPQASAQAVYGSIAGTVADSTGAAVPGATVAITSLDRKTSDSVVTNATGYYSKDRLLPGHYEVKAELSGFKAVVVSSVRVSVDTQSKVDFTLQVGEVSETVMVEGSSVLKSDRADVATTLTKEQITELPVLDRNFTKFVLLTPGAARLGWNHATTENPQMSIQTMINGQHFSGTGYQLDGTENRDPILGIIVINPNLESIGESKITSQNYAAEFGQATAGVVSVQTKSGTNEIQGSAFWVGLTDNFQARNPFTQPKDKPLPETSRNQFGGSIGGPIIKNKWFFFADYAGLRSTQGGSRAESVPTALARTGNFSEYGVDIFDPLSGSGTPATRTQFPGNVIPTGRLSPQSLAILNLLPLPNAAGTVNGTRDNYVISGSEKFDSDAYDVRLDGRLSTSANIFGRYSRAHFDKDSPTAFGDAGGGGGFVEDQGGLSKVTNQSLALGLDYTLSTTSILDVRFGWFNYKVDVLPRDFGTTPSTAAGIPGLNLGDDFTSGMFDGNIEGNQDQLRFGYGLGPNRCNCPLAEDESQWQIAANFTKIVGTDHTFKVGVDVRRAHNLRIPSDSHRAGELTFHGDRTIGPSGGGLGLATFMLGDATHFKRYASTSTDARELQWRHFYYLQDTWRANNKLTLSLGLRLAVINPETVNDPGNGGWLDAGCAPGSQPCQPIGTGEILVGGVGDVDLAGNVKNTLNWEPRLGITYQINDKTVVRAGYGRAHDIGTFGSTFGHAVTQNLPVLSIQEINAPANYAAVFNLAQGPPPATFIDSSTGHFLLPNGVNPFVRTREMRLLRTDSWNVTVQRQLSTSTSVELGYVGNHGSHYMAGDNPDEDMNQPTLVGYPNVPRDQRRPFFALYGWTQGTRADLNDATNDYNSLQAKFTKNMSKGWSLLAHYTFAKAKNFDDGDYFWIDRELNWGTPGWHRVHQVVVAGSYELPFFKGNTLLGGWQVNANVFIASGQPFGIDYRNAGQDRDTGPNRPDLIGDPQIGSGDGRTSPYFNVTPIGSSGSAFGRPAIATFGNLERNAYSGPGWWNVDGSLFKRFAFGRRALELRLEVQNLFNHVNLGNPDGGIGVPGNLNANSGMITGTANNWVGRNLQFGARFLF